MLKKIFTENQIITKPRNLYNYSLRTTVVVPSYKDLKTEKFFDINLRYRSRQLTSDNF
jgi:hypothetical protein